MELPDRSAPALRPAPTPAPDVARAAPAVSLPVIAGGLVTTALTLVLAYWLSAQYGFNAMGLYGWYILPIGALMVGIAAGSGYGLVSWLTGFRIQQRTLWLLVGLQVLAYVVAQYAEYRVIASYGGALPAFPAFFDEVTRAIAFEDDDGVVGQSLGALGYGVRLLEILGFVGGALLIPAGLRSAAYCETCGRYMKSRQIGMLPASVKARRTWGKGDDEKAAYAAEQDTAQAQGQAVHDHLFALAERGDAAAFADAVGLMRDGTKDAGKLPTRVAVSLAACPTCRRGTLKSQVLSGHGRGQTMADLAATPVEPPVVQALDAAGVTRA